ncbi:SHOCT domain-containing protein [Marivirga sp. S37H4]|uniref:SHOCT domain-containing protein n=2 Tax=Marivirga aurantiaca TaxID=2802615 RepID=A0A934WYF9_9BACT|nr:SHOCT domain-containing protein [Marivirga aurantiaca]
MGMTWGVVLGVIIIILIVWFVLKAINKKKKRSRTQGETPLNVLKERYASGEIDKEEYERRKKGLMS